MNKRKTLRMTSILLALMMFFGMVSVLLVPAGTAGAADAQVDIVIDEETSSEYDSDNVIVLDDKTYTLKVSKVLWGNDNKDFVNVKMVLKDWNGKEIAGYTSANPKIMTPSTTEAGMYTCDFIASKATYSATRRGETGLYTMELRRHYANGVMDETSIKVGAFWLAQKADKTTTSGWLNDESTTQKMAENDDTLYIGPGAKIQYDATTTASGVGGSSILKNWITDNSLNDSSLRILNPRNINNGFVKIFDTITSASKYTYNVPSDATHDSKYRFMGIVIEPTVHRSCWAVDFFSTEDNTTPTAKKWTKPYAEGIVDAKGPSVVDAILQNNSYLDWIWDDGIVVKDYNTSYSCAPHAAANEHNFVEVRDIADADSGAGDGYVLFENPFNASVKMGSLTETKLKQGDALTSPFSTHSYYIQSGLSDDSYLFCISEPRHSAFAGSTLAATKNEWYDAKLLNNRWRVKIVAADAVGNETTTTVGIYDFLGTYQQISSIRVEQQNVLEMYVGQTINYEDVLFNGVKVAVNELTTAATFPDNYIWFGKNDTATLKLFSFDYDEQTITAVEAGEGYIYVEPWVNYNKEAASTNASTNGYMKVIVHAQPTVSSITLSSSKLQLAVGAEHKLTATTVPAGVTATWSSTDTAVATVDQNGNVKAVAAGTTTVSVAAGGKYAVCTVTVSDATVIPDPDPPAEDLKGWVDEGNNRYYYVDNQKVVGWRKIDGSWYFFDYTSAAMRANGWLKEGGKWYYLNSNGTMKSAEWFKDNNGKWYWLKANGAMAAGWEKINGTWYYFNASGAMQTGWVNVRGIWYYMKSSGAMAEGWLQDGGSWYYLTPGGGAMVTGRVTINGRASNFATSGRWLGYV